ncbi:TolC family protein [Marinilabiliaceae bacterium ANBcel2]|nr:TolC family protein [Marinilabiliaceae bacterium ANBcel2]
MRSVNKKVAAGITAIWMFCFTLVSGIAQEADLHDEDILELNLERAVEIALDENPIIRIADLEIERVDYALREARSALIPSVSAEGNYTRNVKKPVMFLSDDFFGPGDPEQSGGSGGGAIEMGYDNSYTGNLNASMPLFSYSLYQNIQLSEHDVELAIEASRSSRIEMIAQVRKAYYSLLLAYDSYEVILRSLENAERNFADVQNLYEQGMVSEYDVIRSEVQVNNIKPSVVQARNGIETAKMMVRALLGLHTDVDFSVIDSLNDYNGEDEELHPAIYQLSKAHHNNSDLRHLDLEIERMSTQFDAVRSQRYPTLSAFANYQFTSQADNFRFSEYHWAKPFSVGLQVQIPIFNGFSIRHQEQQVKIGQHQMQLQRENLDRNLSVQVRNAISSMESALEQVESNRSGIAQAERGYEIAQTRYEAGTGTFLELNDAEMALTQARLNLNQSMYEYLEAEAEYRKVIGEAEYFENTMIEEQ